ncbi:MAG: SDR family NAD(P)-dependent oxidoreductase [Myxococcales bacterium]|nr:SDR family NAD(P)-dependent oxidoreductase [Myxococcales bacterium]
MSDAKVCVVVGVGPGLGEALARTFAREGWRVAVMARSVDKVRALADDIGGLAVPCDATDNDAIRQAFATVREQLGPVHTLLWNVGSGVFGDLDKVDVAGMELAWRTNALGLFVAAKEVVGDMRAAGEGNLVVTGATASRRGKPFTTAFAAGKAAQRSLCQSLARQLWPEGIHVALVVVDGGIRPADTDRPPETMLAPADIATTALHLARQPRSAWTFELEVRPHVESW